MNANRILQLNAAATMTSGVGMLLARGLLYPLFGLASPFFLDVIAVAFIIYAGALWFTARRPVVGRRLLMAFSAADALWVVISAAILALFWSRLSLEGRGLIIAVAVVVEAFATLQFLAARRVPATTGGA